MKRGDITGIEPDLKKIIKGFKDLSAKLDREKLLKILAIIIAVFILNFIIASKLWGGQEFFINWSSARILFFKGINPYSQKGLEFLIESSKNWHVIPKIININLLNPLYSLFLYFPFSLTQNFYLARAFWLIFNEILLFLSCRFVLRIIGFKDDQQVSGKLLLYFFSYFYSILVLLQGSEYIYLFFIFLGALRWIKEKKYLGTGVLLSILMVKVQVLFPLLLFLLIYLFFEKGWSALIWFLISLALMGIASYFFVPDWPIMYFRAIVTNDGISGIALPGEQMMYWINSSPPVIWNSISVLCFAVILIELFLLSIDSKKIIWVLCLIITLYPLILIQKSLGIMCFLLLPMSFIFRQWIERNRWYGALLMNISFLIFSLLLFSLAFLTKSLDYKEPFSAVFYFLPIAFTLINLYWVRGWLNNNLSIF